MSAQGGEGAPPPARVSVGGDPITSRKLSAAPGDIAALSRKLSASSIDTESISEQITRSRALSNKDLKEEKAARRGSNLLVPPPMLTTAAAAEKDPALAAKVQQELEDTAAQQKAEKKLADSMKLEFEQQLKGGLPMLKHGRQGKPHTRHFFIPENRPTWVEKGTEDFRCLCWVKPPSKAGAPLNETEDAYVMVSDIIEVNSGKTTAVFRKSSIRSARPSALPVSIGRKASAAKAESTFDEGADPLLCFSLVCSTRTLDLQCETKKQRDNMVACM